jgi:transposase
MSSVANAKRVYTAEFKSQVVLEFITGKKTVAQLSHEHSIKDTLIYNWRTQFVERSPHVFQEEAEYSAVYARNTELEQMIGRLTMQIEALKKASLWLEPASSKSERL